jgi:hypothetical protein
MITRPARLAGMRERVRAVPCPHTAPRKRGTGIYVSQELDRLKSGG